MKQTLSNVFLKKITVIIVILMGLALATHLVNRVVYSDELDDLNKQIAELQNALTMSQNATKPLESQLTGLKKQLDSIDAQVRNIENDIEKKKEDIDKGYLNLADKQEVFNYTVRNSYIKSYGFNPLLIFLSGEDAGDVTKLITYHQRYTERDKNTITNIALQIVDLEERKISLEKQQKQLASAKATLDRQRGEVQKVVDGAKAYQSELTGKIATLTAKQQQIMAARSGGFTFSIGSGELADEYLSSIKGFRESAPSGYYAIFSFGAYTHRNGMSQYGARGRAQEGQSYQDILNKYYPGSNLETKGDLPGEINVRGFGNMSFEDRYLLGIAEMPSSWHPEALKAQAIAARTYAYRNRDMAGGICTDEGCQVFSPSKADNPPQAWRDAVQSTRGQVLMKDGQPVSTQYASTHGGFTNTSGWDTRDGSGGNDFMDRAWDKIGGSPWAYKAWWREGYSNSSSTCGRVNPWLSPEEMADIVNAAIALKTGGIDTSRIAPTTTSCWPGTNPYSMEELRNLVSGNGGISSVNSAVVTQGNGVSLNVKINNNIDITGLEFKYAVCLRAPGFIRIPQGGCDPTKQTGDWAFFNIEKK